MKRLLFPSDERYQTETQPNPLEICTLVSLVIAGTTVITSNKAIANNPNAPSADYLFMITSDWRDCLEIGREYQEVYAFETASFYVNICRKGDRYFYSSEAKQEGVGSIFIPAYPLESGRGYQADNGNVSYLVLLPFARKIGNESLTGGISPLPSEAILKIERNNRLVLLESSLTKYCQQSDRPIAFDPHNSTSNNSDRLATILPQLDTSELLLFQHQNSDDSLWQKPLNSDRRFDFYTVEGELHFLTTCS